MESGNEVPSEPEVSVDQVNEGVTDPENVNKVDEQVDSSTTTEVNQPTENNNIVDKTKTQNQVKASSTSTKGNALKNTKLSKSSPNIGTFGRTQRPGLSQSLSFPAKTRSLDSTSKPVVEPTLSTSRSHPASRRSSSGLKPVKTSVKEDDGTSSTGSPITTTPGGRRRTSTGFTSRLDERAERRKEFNSKIEEKVHAKEVEKSNLQAKSKESQEKEIKKLRKSLTFKATPMPNFYKEPPPKPQLKKIPTTRPKSPKLGRSKSSLSKTSEPIEASNSPRAERDQTMSPRVNSTSRNKGSSLHNRKSLTKTSEVNTKSKEKVVKPEVKEEKQSHEVDAVQESGIGSSSVDQDTTPQQIVVGS
ncbi:uncharacterized protein LOC143627905 [Bidens hawaiensis]|uniref:uncharacterized protein LOC143627905 n=1 Tax=Bidens hawaiensis TaxID=980011 RepID=UPI00404A3D16